MEKVEISEDEHIWQPTDVPEVLKDTFKLKYECIRCNCEKLVSKRHSYIVQYSREMIMYNEEPRCFGSIPINEQTID